MLTIYHAKQTRSIRPIWLCYELGVDVEIITLPFTADGLADESFRAVSPAGKIPAMVDGDLTLLESGAIVETILDRYGNDRLRPAAGSNERAWYTQWCSFSESTLLRPLGYNRIARTPKDAADALLKDAQDKVRSALGLVEQALDQQEFLVGGAFTAADIMMGYALALLNFSRTLDEQTPNCRRYLDQLMAREACQRAIAA